jgi:hypothetical protein
LPVKCFRYRCSTPQKHPAATVALAEPSGLRIELPLSAAFKPRLDAELKGRTRREMKDGIVDAMRIADMAVMSMRSGGSNAILQVIELG